MGQLQELTCALWDSYKSSPVLCGTVTRAHLCFVGQLQELTCAAGIASLIVCTKGVDICHCCHLAHFGARVCVLYFFVFFLKSLPALM